MALIRKFERRSMERNSLHRSIRATYTPFEHDGRVSLQIDSYGSETRESPGKKSQSFQLDREGATALLAMIRREFALS